MYLARHELENAVTVFTVIVANSAACEFSHGSVNVPWACLHVALAVP